MTLEPRIYLASKSPRRRELLTQIGVRFDLLMFRTPPREDAAAAKAGHGAELVAARRLVARPVLAADTTLDVDGDVVGKPRDAAEAIDILQRLSGRTHRVITAVALAHAGAEECLANVSEVRFRKLGTDEIRRYVASNEPLDKAGAYGLQGRAAIFVEEVRGSPSGIVGLPLCETALLLRKFGYPL
jgi:septum formation protein